MPHPYRSEVLEVAGSTNAEAFARAAAGETGPLWVMALRQTAGRGRAGRRWASEPGNLYASLLSTLSCPPGSVHQLSLVAGVATIDAIRAAAGGGIAGLRLKWPNDVLIGAAKCAGILAEAQARGTATTAVLGIGINLAWHPKDLGRAATDLASHGVRIAPEAMLGLLAEATGRWLGAWDNGAGFAGVRAAWLERAGPKGERMAVDTGQERLEGTFVDVDSDGALLIEDASGLCRRLTFGDVTLAGGVLRKGG